VYRKILVPLDGSDLAEAPLDYAQRLAAKAGAELILLHVCVPRECHSLAHGGDSDTEHRLYLEGKAEDVRRSMARSGCENPVVRSVLLTGEPSYEIPRYADESPVDLIAMATHGRSGVRHWVMGSVAIHVHRCSRVPIRLVRSFPAKDSPPNWPERRILVLLDGSDLAEQVVPYVIDHGKMGHATVTLIRVNEPPHGSAAYPKSMPLSWEEYSRRVTNQQLQQSRSYLQGIARQLRLAGLAVRTCSLLGNPASEIVEYIERHRFNLTAMTTSAVCAGGVWPIGSVASSIINGTSTPILLVKHH
jgi:nucleotide-binding universal stress UspA family protein